MPAHELVLQGCEEAGGQVKPGVEETGRQGQLSWEGFWQTAVEEEAGRMPWQVGASQRGGEELQTMAGAVEEVEEVVLVEVVG